MYIKFSKKEQELGNTIEIKLCVKYGCGEYIKINKEVHVRLSLLMII